MTVHNRRRQHTNTHHLRPASGRPGRLIALALPAAAGHTRIHETAMRQARHEAMNRARQRTTSEQIKSEGDERGRPRQNVIRRCFACLRPGPSQARAQGQTAATCVSCVSRVSRARPRAFSRPDDCQLMSQKQTPNQRNQGRRQRQRQFSHLRRRRWRWLNSEKVPLSPVVSVWPHDRSGDRSRCPARNRTRLPVIRQTEHNEVSTISEHRKKKQHKVNKGHNRKGLTV